jgi:peptidoglycan/LPS O-acetylase OafA/YrhL
MGLATESGRGHHYPALDGLRGVAALMVFGFHFLQAAPSAGWVGRLKSVASVGQSGVDLFFVLSGFLITGILLDEKTSRRPLFTFYGRRAVRIFPLYYAALVIYFFVLPAVHHAPGPGLTSFGWYAVYAQNVLSTFRWEISGPGHFWSLAVEEHFYVVWPLVVLHASTRGVVRSALALIAVSVVARVLLIAAGFEVFYFTLCRLDGLAGGSLLAVAVRAPDSSRAVRRTGAAAVAVAVAVCAPAYAALSGAGSTYLQVLKPLCWAVLYVGVVAVLVSSRPTAPLVAPFSWRVLRSVGKYSYAIYVFHPPIIHALLRTFPDSIPVAFAASLCCAYGAAVLSWALIEAPALRWKKKLPYRSAAPLPPAWPDRPAPPSETACGPAPQGRAKVGVDAPG